MQGITHRIGDKGELVTVCTDCERRDPDLRGANPGGAIYWGVHYGLRSIEHCDHPAHEHDDGGAE